MLFRVKCPNPGCRRELQIDSALAGKQLQCAACRGAFLAPAPPRAGPPAPTPKSAPPLPRSGGTGPLLWLTCLGLVVLVGCGTAVAWFFHEAKGARNESARLAEEAHAAREEATMLKASLAEAGRKARRQSARLAELEKRAPTTSKEPAELAPLRSQLAAAEREARAERERAALLEKRLAELERGKKGPEPGKPPTEPRKSVASPYAAIDEHALKAPPEAEGSLGALASYLVSPAKNDRDKARAIFRWIADRIAYDVEGLLEKRLGDNGAPAVLRRRRCVCAGYANLFQALCQQAGLEAVVVLGQGRSPLSSGSHAWNAVKLEGRWFLLDSTWGAGGVDLVKRTFLKRLNEDFWCAEPDALVFSHFPVDAKWQLLRPPVSREEFGRLGKADAQSVRTLIRLGALSAGEARRKALGPDFRPLVRAMPHPDVGLVFRQVPLEKKLRAGEEYVFRVEASRASFVDVIEGGRPRRLARSGDAFEAKVTPERGRLVLGVSTLDRRDFIHWVLEYVVE